MSDDLTGASTGSDGSGTLPTGTLPVADPTSLRVARVIERTTAEGPGVRTAIWVQGCTVRCPECFNPHLWADLGGALRKPDDILAEVLAAGTQGLTLLGGEPFDQAAPLAVLASGVRAAGRSVMTFTGYRLEWLRDAASAGRDDVAQLLEATDLLVDGPYLSDHPDVGRPWVGSTNQRFHVLTERYRAVAASLDRHPDRIEVRVQADGRVGVNGWATAADLDDLLSGL